MDTAHEEVRNRVHAAINELMRSERGRSIIPLLHGLLDSPVSHLDGYGWHAIEALIDLYRDGWAGTVLETLQSHIPITRRLRRKGGG